MITRAGRTRALVVAMAVLAALLGAKGHTVSSYGFFDGPG
jgi:hypothetical protein